MPSAPATCGEHAITSLATSLRNCARGLSAPFLWFFHAMRVIASLNCGLVDAELLAVGGGEQAEGGGGGEAGARCRRSGAPMLGSPEKPESFSFSTPMAMATS